MSTENTPPASGDEPVTEGAKGSSPTEGTPENRASDNPRQRRSTLVAVSVAAAVLLAGGGGAYWASTAGDGGGGQGTPAAGQGDPPPLKLDGYGQSAKHEGPAGIAPGEPDPSGNEYRAEGRLPEAPGSAHVYRAQGEVTREQAEKLAKALDVPGAPRLDAGTWKFGTPDTAGPTLDINSKAPGTWTYVRYGTTTDCAEPGPKDGPDGKKGASPRCAAPGEAPAPKDDKDKGSGPVSEEKAKKAVGPALKGIGLSDAKLDAGQTVGALRMVNAEPKYDGLPTYGWQTGLQVGADGQVVGGSGHLTRMTKGADYPVLSAQEALKRLNAMGGGGKVGIAGCASAVPHDGSMGIEGGEKPGEENCPPAGGKRPTDRGPLTVRDATFGLAIHYVDGKQALVPSWMFEVEQPGTKTPDDSYTVTHPAVQPKYLAGSSSDDGPTAKPEKPGKPGKAGSGTQADIESYSADGRTLTLKFWGGVCHTYTASVNTSDGSVQAEIRGEEKNPGEKCIKIAKQYEKKVQLDKPLGERKVVDASDGKTVAKK
ncbi:hypothetical protein [Streptomyces sp. bgisy100]|uniref:hypothetical protein n=1 Tax=Streptomyces sp. bgisy100 TaxID=3413783 RepID=UPI003D742D4C